MIDLDAIKASGANADMRSAEIMALHEWRESVRLQGEMLAKCLRDGVTSAGYARQAGALLEDATR